ncbi:MAG TPA: AAA family ATPase [bacterium]|nr:AAA family ATPase [bacterium]
MPDAINLLTDAPMRETNPEITARHDAYREAANAAMRSVGTIVVGQERLVRNVFIALFAGGHVLLEGVPGLGKTLALSSVARSVDCSFARVSFTPDLLPSDIIGGQIYRQNTGMFETRKGPIFTNFLLADEINRAPAKVQSALLEAMQERRVTIADTTYSLDAPFVVLATQNPIEQDGTYALPEAQQDRFLFKTVVDYPSKDEEIGIMK